MGSGAGSPAPPSSLQQAHLSDRCHLANLPHTSPTHSERSRSRWWTHYTHGPHMAPNVRYAWTTHGPHMAPHTPHTWPTPGPHMVHTWSTLHSKGGRRQPFALHRTTPQIHTCAPMDDATAVHKIDPLELRRTACKQQCMSSGSKTSLSKDEHTAHEANLDHAHMFMHTLTTHTAHAHVLSGRP
eukprot:355775-Chlamydomonas_euryale.AAC.4